MLYVASGGSREQRTEHDQTLTTAKEVWGHRRKTQERVSRGQADATGLLTRSGRSDGEESEEASGEREMCSGADGARDRPSEAERRIPR